MFLRPPELINELEGRANIDQHGEKFTRKIINIHIPVEGGVFLEYEGVSHLEAGFPLWDTVHALDMNKKFFSGMLKAVQKTFAGGKIKTLLLVLFFRKELKAVLYEAAQAAYRQLKNYRFYDKRYCKAVKEIRRVMEAIKPADKENALVWDRIIMLTFLFLEFDIAYRYRVQYVLGRLDKKKLAHRPMKEIARLCALGAAREGSGQVKKVWQALGWVVWVVRFIPAYRKYFVRFFTEVNPEEVGFTEADKFFAIEKTEKSPFPEFDFRDL